MNNTEYYFEIYSYETHEIVNALKSLQAARKWINTQSGSYYIWKVDKNGNPIRTYWN